MKPDSAATMLEDELMNLYTFRLATVLVPVRRLLRALDEERLRRAISTLGTQFADCVHDILSQYAVEFRRPEARHPDAGTERTW